MQVFTVTDATSMPRPDQDTDGLIMLGFQGFCRRLTTISEKLYYRIRSKNYTRFPKLRMSPIPPPLSVIEAAQRGLVQPGEIAFHGLERVLKELPGLYPAPFGLFTAVEFMRFGFLVRC